MAAGDFNGDGYFDLAIGVPDDDFSGVAGSGAVNVIYGSAGGLTATNNQIWHENLLATMMAEVDDNFGRVLATGDFTGDGYADLVVGVPYKDLDSLEDAGIIQIIYGSTNGLTAEGNHYFKQGLGGSQGTPEAGDGLGFALTAGRFGKSGGLIFMPLILRN